MPPWQLLRRPNCSGVQSSPHDEASPTTGVSHAPRGLSSYCSLTRECGFVAFDVAVPVRLQDHLARDLRPDSNSISRLLNTWSKEDAESF